MMINDWIWEGKLQKSFNASRSLLHWLMNSKAVKLIVALISGVPDIQSEFGQSRSA